MMEIHARLLALPAGFSLAIRALAGTAMSPAPSAMAAAMDTIATAVARAYRNSSVLCNLLPSLELLGGYGQSSCCDLYGRRPPANPG